MKKLVDHLYIFMDELHERQQSEIDGWISRAQMAARPIPYEKAIQAVPEYVLRKHEIENAVLEHFRDELIWGEDGSRKERDR